MNLCIIATILYILQHGNTALSYACSKGHSEIVAALLIAGADPNIESQEVQCCCDFNVCFVLAKDKVVFFFFTLRQEHPTFFDWGEPEQAPHQQDRIAHVCVFACLLAAIYRKL